MVHCTHCEVDGRDEEHCWKLHPERWPKKFGGKGKKKTFFIVQEDLGSYLGDETKIAAMGVQVRRSLHIGSSSNNVSQVNDKRRSGLFHIIFVSKHT